MLQKNDLISLVITDITNEASGVGRHEGSPFLSRVQRSATG